MVGKQSRTDHEVRQGLERRERIRRIGKDDIVTYTSVPLQEAEHIGANDLHGLEIEFLCRTTDKVGLHAIGFDRGDGRSTARGKLVRDAARATEKIKNRDVGEIDVASKDVEERLFGKVGSRTSDDVTWRLDAPPLA